MYRDGRMYSIGEDLVELQMLLSSQNCVRVISLYISQPIKSVL